MSELYNHEDFKVEIIAGKEIVMMAPAFDNHNVAKNSIFSIFSAYLKGNVCIPYSDGSKVVLEDGGYVIPDMFVLCDRSKRKRDGIYGAPDLVAEVLSYSSAKNDRGDKKDLYEKTGVREYWLVEPDEKYIEVYLLEYGRYKLDGLYRIAKETDSEDDIKNTVTKFNCGIFPELEIDLEEVFQNVIDW